MPERTGSRAKVLCWPHRMYEAATGQSALPPPSRYSFGAAIAAWRTEWNLALDAWNRPGRSMA